MGNVMDNSQHKIAIVTGGSNSRDIGTAICRKLASQGIDIFFTHWNSKRDWTESFHREIVSMGVRCEELDIDLSEINAASEIFDIVTERLGMPSILVNNAAHSISDGYMELNAKILDDHYTVNMRSCFLLCVEFARRFETYDLDAGRIINMTSGQDIGPMPGELAYVATVQYQHFQDHCHKNWHHSG